METAIKPTRSENYPEWYQQVIKAADLAENSPVRGCMVIKPWGYGIWELIQKNLDGMIKDTGHDNAYFPLFIPLSYLAKEAQHVDGFAKECAVVTHHRLEVKDGKLVPAGELEEPLVVRPTSEMIIGEAFSRWIQSYRDLPLLINQWANVVRWEMRPRIFLRTAEFLWQEGHTAHATKECAEAEVKKMIDVYEDLATNILGIPVFKGSKSKAERFPGAEDTITIEAIMQDGKALQAGTSHYLGQNFAKGCEIKFLDQDGSQKYVHTTSWGASTRLMGGLIMVHSDDNGLRVPPKIAPTQVIIIPVIPKPELSEKVLAYCEQLKADISKLQYFGSKVRVKIDNRDIRGGEKTWGHIKKGVPIRIDVGPRDIDAGKFMLARRDQEPKDKNAYELAQISMIPDLLQQIQDNLYIQAKDYRDKLISKEIKNFDELKEYFSDEKAGFVIAPYFDATEHEEKLSELKVTVRCLLLSEKGKKGICIVSGKETTETAVFARTY